MQILGPYHASHLHHTSHIDLILTQDTRDVLGKYEVTKELYSTKTGKPFDTKTTVDLVRQCLEQILIDVLDWDLVLRNVAQDVLASGAHCHVLPVGSTNLSHSLLTALKEVGVSHLSLEDHHAQSVNGDQGSRKGPDSKIAIVGMAGRFPSAADHELFWELLEKGLDVHREVRLQCL